MAPPQRWGVVTRRLSMAPGCLVQPALVLDFLIITFPFLLLLPPRQAPLQAYCLPLKQTNVSIALEGIVFEPENLEVCSSILTDKFEPSSLVLLFWMIEPAVYPFYQ